MRKSAAEAKKRAGKRTGDRHIVANQVRISDATRDLLAEIKQICGQFYTYAVATAIREYHARLCGRGAEIIQTLK